MTINLVPISLRDACSKCGGKWKVIELSVAERMEMRVGRSLVAECTNCQRRAVALTPKQDKKLEPKQQKPAPHMSGKIEEYDPRLTFGVVCLNAYCNQAFCPTHSPIDVWMGGEVLLDVPSAF